MYREIITSSALSCWECRGSRWGETSRHFFKFAVLGGVVPLYCTRILSITALKWNSAVAGCKIRNGWRPIITDPDPSGRGCSKTGPGYGDGLWRGYPPPGGRDCWIEVSESGATWTGMSLSELYLNIPDPQIQTRFLLSRVLQKVGQCLLCIIQ